MVREIPKTVRNQTHALCSIRRNFHPLCEGSARLNRRPYFKKKAPPIVKVGLNSEELFG